MYRSSPTASHNRANLPDLCIIVPIYNVEAYLEECISSILRQTYKNIEVILVDDGSTGCEAAICDSFAASDSRVKVIHKENGGLISARKAGLEATTAPYVTFVDGDDYISHDLYNDTMHIISSEEPDLLAFGFTRTTGSEQAVVSNGIQSGTYSGKDLLYLQHNMNCINHHYYDTGIIPSVWSKIYKTDRLAALSRDIPEVIRMGEDAAFTFPYVLNAEKVVVDNSINGYYYRQVPGSMSRKADPGLFYGSALLYKYLKQSYYSKNDAEIDRQLGYYHTYLKELALNFWMSVSIFTIPEQSRKIKGLVSDSTLFDDSHPNIESELYVPLKTYLKLIHDHRWISFKIYWFVNHTRTVIQNLLQKTGKHRPK